MVDLPNGTYDLFSFTAFKSGPEGAPGGTYELALRSDVKTLGEVYVRREGKTRWERILPPFGYTSPPSIERKPYVLDMMDMYFNDTRHPGQASPLGYRIQDLRLKGLIQVNAPKTNLRDAPLRPIS